MRIGELARQSGVPASALRYYEQIGLLPVSPRKESGYREFHPDTLGLLGFVRAAQAIGLTLNEIREVIGIREGGRAPCLHVRDLVSRRRTDVRDRIAELRALEQDLDRITEVAERIDPADCDPSGICGVISLG